MRRSGRSSPPNTIHRQMVGFSRVSRVRVRIRVSIRIRVMFSFSGANLNWKTLGGELLPECPLMLLNLLTYLTTPSAPHLYSTLYPLPHAHPGILPNASGWAGTKWGAGWDQQSYWTTHPTSYYRNPQPGHILPIALFAALHLPSGTLWTVTL